MQHKYFSFYKDYIVMNNQQNRKMIRFYIGCLRSALYGLSQMNKFEQTNKPNKGK